MPSRRCALGSAVGWLNLSIEARSLVLASIEPRLTLSTGLDALNLSIDFLDDSLAPANTPAPAAASPAPAPAMPDDAARGELVGDLVGETGGD